MARGRTGVGCPWETVGSTRGVRGLGQVVPLAGAVGTTAVKYLIGSVLAGAGAAIVGGMLGGPDTQDSWADRTVFNARMRATHAGFLMVQCQVGGAKVNEGYGCDDNDHNCLCPGGTHPRCSLPSGKLTEWRALRSNFSAFYSEVGGATYFESDNWTVSDPTPGEILQARGFARSLVAFFIALPSVCPNYTLPFDLADIVAADEGTTAQMVAEQTAITLAEPEPTWVKGARYVAWGLGAVTVLWVGNTLYTVYKDRKRA